MTRSTALSREEVSTAIVDWGRGAISDEEMRSWVVQNYFPAHQAVAPGAPDRVALAIGAVLTEFECAWPPYRFGRDVAMRALDLIYSQDSDYQEREEEFYKSVAAGHDDVR